MNRCLEDGDLRAHLDGEMPEAAAHLETCAVCADRYREIADRAAWVYQTLTPAEPAPAISTRWRWAALSIAATVALAFLLLPKSAPVASAPEEFVRLDDHPIETGTLVRVSTEDGLQADLIVGPDGRAHAFRIVSNSYAR
jgi:hypothetical protein